MTSPSKEKLKAALDLGQMAHRMVEGYYMHLAATHVAKDPRATFLSPTVELGQMVPVGRIRHKDGTRHEFHFTHYLAQAGTDPAIADHLDRVWLVGALLTIGDPKVFRVYRDKLYLCTTPADLKEFSANLDTNIAKADKYHCCPVLSFLSLHTNDLI
jgi:hypothetical protein